MHYIGERNSKLLNITIIFKTSMLKNNIETFVDN